MAGIEEGSTSEEAIEHRVLQLVQGRVAQAGAGVALVGLLALAEWARRRAQFERNLQRHHDIVDLLTSKDARQHNDAGLRLAAAGLVHFTGTEATTLIETSGLSPKQSHTAALMRALLRTNTFTTLRMQDTGTHVPHIAPSEAFIGIVLDNPATIPGVVDYAVAKQPDFSLDALRVRLSNPDVLDNVPAVE